MLNFTQPLGMRGEFTLRVRDKFGNLKRIWNENWLGKSLRLELGWNLKIPFITGGYDNKLHIRNLVVSAGLAGVASRINGSGAEAAFTYLAVGTGTNAAAAGDTTLQTEIVDSGLARHAATCTRVTTTVANDTAQLDYTWSVTGTKAVTEAGALNAGAVGTLLGRQVFSAVNVVNGDSLNLIYKFASANA